jgi:cytochrome c oxidase subunit II
VQHAGTEYFRPLNSDFHAKGDLPLRTAVQMQKLSLVLFAGLLLGIGARSSFGRSPQAEAQPQVIEVSANKYEFTPAEIHVKQGAKVELKVHSTDETHGIELDLYPEGAKDKKTPGLVFSTPSTNGKVAKGEDQVLDFVGQLPGTYNFKCAKMCGMGHGRMKGKLIVDPI